jgi:protein TonB
MKTSPAASKNPEPETAPEPGHWLGNRNIVVPPDIVPVRRVSPLQRKRRTPCRPWADGVPVSRTGSREWFGDHVFADGQPRDFRGACGTSIAAHAGCLIGLSVLLATPPASTPPARVGEPLRMPVFVAAMGSGAGGGADLAASPLRDPAPDRQEQAAKGRVADATPVRPLPRQTPVPTTAAPEVAPATEQVESGAPAHTENIEDTAVRPPDGAAGGAGDAGGATGDGTGSGGGGAGGSHGRGVSNGPPGIAMSPGPYRLGEGIEPPRKIKDVAPVYPSAAMAMRALGTVVIEAIVGVDGKIREAKVIHSIPQLDHAALEAVRQWEFAPARLNGVAVAAIVTILVTFSIY